MQQLALALGIQFLTRPQKMTSPYPPPFCAHLFMDQGLALAPEAETLVTTSMILDALSTAVSVDTHPLNQGFTAASWETRIEEGIEMIASGITAAQFITRHSFMLQSWQKLAYQFVKQNNGLVLTILAKKNIFPEDDNDAVVTETRVWRIVSVAGYVEFTQTFLGEDKVYISKDGKTKVLVEA